MKPALPSPSVVRVRNDGAVRWIDSEEVGVGRVDQRGDRLGVLDQVSGLLQLEAGVDRHQDGSESWPVRARRAGTRASSRP